MQAPINDNDDNDDENDIIIGGGGPNEGAGGLPNHDDKGMDDD